MLTHLSLFSGIGGLDLAAEWAGFQTVLIYGEVYDAAQNKYGAVCGICENGQKLGVKPGEFEIVEDTP